MAISDVHDVVLTQYVKLWSTHANPRYIPHSHVGLQQVAKGSIDAHSARQMDHTRTAYKESYFRRRSSVDRAAVLVLCQVSVSCIQLELLKTPSLLYIEPKDIAPNWRRNHTKNAPILSVLNDR